MKIWTVIEDPNKRIRLWGRNRLFTGLDSEQKERRKNYEVSSWTILDVMAYGWNFFEISTVLLAFEICG
jgi:hypothetical protein